jgi:hypothetical protein
MQDMQEGVYPKKIKKSVAGQFAAVKYSMTISLSETHCWTQKQNREDHGVDKDKKYFLLLSKSKQCKKKINTVAFT